MPDLALVTAGKLSIVRSDIQELLIAGVDLTVGDVITVSKTTGKWIKADADGGDIDAPLYVAMSTAKAGFALSGLKKGIVDGFDLSALDYRAPVFLSTNAAKMATAVAAVNEVQTLTVSGAPDGGTFKLSFEGEETSALTYDESAADIKAALEALASVGVGNVAVAGSAGGPWTVTFQAGLGGKDVPLLVLSDNSLTGGTTPSVGIVQTTAGVTTKQIGYVLPGNNQPIGSSPDKVLYVDL